MQLIRYRKPQKGKVDALLRSHYREVVEQEKSGLIDDKIDTSDFNIVLK